MNENINRFKEMLFRKVDPGSLAIFRSLFGFIMVWEVYRYFSKGWIAKYFIVPDYTFPFMYFDWLKPLPGDGMYYLFGLIGITSFFIAIGFLYRVSAVLFFLSFTYVFLLCKTRYLNHFYLVSLIGFLLMFLPANRIFSVDHWLLKKSGKIKPNFDLRIPYWTLLIMQLQIGYVYFWGGIAKINKDWLKGSPMKDWLPPRDDFPIIGQFFHEEWMAYFFSYSGLLLDLFALPFLMFKKTRVFMMVGLAAFHLSNARLFHIGIFPWFMLGAMLIYLDPGFPKKWFVSLAKTFGEKVEIIEKKIPSSDMQFPIFKPAFYFFAVYMAIQTILPIRHFFIPGDVSWTEDGHNFAWHMKLRSKRVKMKVWVIDKATGEKWKESPYDHIERRQWRTVKARPSMLLKFSHIVKDYYKVEEGRDVEIYVESTANLNNRGYQQWIDPEVNLADQEMRLTPYPWVVPSKF